MAQFWLPSAAIKVAARAKSIFLSFFTLLQISIFINIYNKYSFVNIYEKNKTAVVRSQNFDFLSYQITRIRENLFCSAYRHHAHRQERLLRHVGSLLYQWCVFLLIEKKKVHNNFCFIKVIFLLHVLYAPVKLIKMDFEQRNEEKKILVRLAVNRIDHSFPRLPEQNLTFFTPGEEISTQPDFLRYNWNGPSLFSIFFSISNIISKLFYKIKRSWHVHEWSRNIESIRCWEIRKS